MLVLTLSDKDPAVLLTNKEGTVIGIIRKDDRQSVRRQKVVISFSRDLGIVRWAVATDEQKAASLNL